jgi:hypothetical protein
MIVRGPFSLTWGDNTLDDIESIDINYQTNSEIYAANSGLVYQIDKSMQANVTLTLLANDIASLAVVLPQYYVAQGGELGDGSFVSDSRGAIDIRADDCDTEPIYNDLIVTSCGNPSESFKLLSARTIIEGFEIGKIRKIVVKFIGEPDAGKSLIQLIGNQELTEELFLLGDGDLFELGNGENLIL